MAVAASHGQQALPHPSPPVASTAPYPYGTVARQPMSPLDMVAAPSPYAPPPASGTYVPLPAAGNYAPQPAPGGYAPPPAPSSFAPLPASSSYTPHTTNSSFQAAGGSAVAVPQQQWQPQGWQLHAALPPSTALPAWQQQQVLGSPSHQSGMVAVQQQQQPYPFPPAAGMGLPPPSPGQWRGEGTPLHRPQLQATQAAEGLGSIGDVPSIIQALQRTPLPQPPVQHMHMQPLQYQVTPQAPVAQQHTPPGAQFFAAPPPAGGPGPGQAGAMPPFWPPPPPLTSAALNRHQQGGPALLSHSPFPMWAPPPPGYMYTPCPGPQVVGVAL